MSFERSETPSSPDFLLTMVSSLSAASRALGVVAAIFLSMKMTTPGSMSPVRDPEMMPEVGVSDMEVSRHLPSLMAEMDAPLPR